MTVVKTGGQSQDNNPQQLTTPGGYVLPPDSPPGLLEFLIGIQKNESGFDYFRDQGSASGSVGTYGGGAEEGFGAYQFTGPQSQQVQEASAAGWDPYTQDKIAADMATGYYHAYGGENNPNIWADVTEAWYGPGTVGTAENDVLNNPNAPSEIDWENVRSAEEGAAYLPSAWVYGNTPQGQPYQGLTSAQVQQELSGQPIDYTGTPQGPYAAPSSAQIAATHGSANLSTIGNILASMDQLLNGKVVGSPGLVESIATLGTANVASATVNTLSLLFYRGLFAAISLGMMWAGLNVVTRDMASRTLNKGLAIGAGAKGLGEISASQQLAQQRLALAQAREGRFVTEGQQRQERFGQAIEIRRRGQDISQARELRLDSGEASRQKLNLARSAELTSRAWDRRTRAIINRRNSLRSESNRLRMSGGGRYTSRISQLDKRVAGLDKALDDLFHYKAANPQIFKGP